MEWIRAIRNKPFRAFKEKPRRRGSGGAIVAPARAGWRNRHSSFGDENRPLVRQSCSWGHHGIWIPDGEGAAQRRRHEKNKNQHRCSADSCAVHTARWSCWHQGSEIICCCRSGIGLEGKDSMIGWWLVHEGCMINGSTHIFSFFKRKRNDNEGFDDVYYIVVLAP